jgi:hypothetical protein
VMPVISALRLVTGRTLARTGAHHSSSRQATARGDGKIRAPPPVMTVVVLSVLGRIEGAAFPALR